MSSWVSTVERALDGVRARRGAQRTPEHFRIESYGGHGSSAGIVVRGRVVDDPPLSIAVEGEGVRAAVRRQVRGFWTHELPDVPLRIDVAGCDEQARTDADGYFRVRLTAGPLRNPSTAGTVELAGDYRGLPAGHHADLLVHVPGPDADFGIISDIDDTILETGVQRVAAMVAQTFTGSALTRTPFPGAPELYRDLSKSGANPVFYVSSSPWNLHGFIIEFLRHRGFPPGPVLLRDLLGTAAGREEKHDRIREVLELHPGLRFVLLGDSGERDPEIYADIVREHPGRIIAVYIREVRLDPGDGRVEQVADAWDHDVPFVLAADSEAVRRHAAQSGLLQPESPTSTPTSPVVPADRTVPDRPEIVCLCGSIRFADEMRAANRDLTLSGVIVVAPGEADEVIAHEQKIALDALHLRKIDLADRVLVVNPGGYIGESTRREIAYAHATRKPVSFTDPV